MIINQRTLALRAQVEEAVKDLHQLCQQIGHEELSELVGDLRNRMAEPYMFVIVGEVKAGKSSFVNALLDAGREICPVAPQPMTDTIQQILYGEEEQEIFVNPFLKKIHLPVEILRELAIVDTPGTNSIIEKHQEITENFIPASDLVVFVFEAKNPYRQSAWDFFEFIQKDWHKKIIFILQQKDLLPEGDLRVNEQGLYDFARKKGMESPVIFSVSAKAEQEGRFDESGFSGVRDFIRTHVTGGRGAALKLGNNIETSLHILGRIRNDLSLRKQQYEQDVNFRTDVFETLERQENRSKFEAQQLIENLLNGYDRITRQIGKELERGLSFPAMLRRSFLGMIGRQSSVKEWLDGLTEKLSDKLNAELRNKLNDGVLNLADSIQQMAKMIDLKIRNSQIQMVRSDSYIFDDIAERRTSVLKDLQDAFEGFMKKSDNFTDEKLFPADASISPSIAAGSGMAVIGIVLAAVTQTAVFDITGGIITGIGVLFAGITASIQKNKLVRQYQEEIASGRERILEALQHKLDHYIGSIKGRIASNFDGLDELLRQESEQIENIEERQLQLNARLRELEDSLSA